MNKKKSMVVYCGEIVYIIFMLILFIILFSHTGLKATTNQLQFRSLTQKKQNPKQKHATKKTKQNENKPNKQTK